MNTEELPKKFDRELYAEVVAVTQEIAKERGMFWEEEQAEITYAIITNPIYLSRLKVNT